MSKTELIKRYAVMIFGTALMTFGIDMPIHANIGTTPLSTLPCVFSIQFPQISFGAITMIWNIILILIQVVILRKNFKASELLQIPISIFFSIMLDLNEYLLFWLTPESMVSKIIVTVIACVIIGFSIAITVISNAVINCGEAVVKAISETFKLNFGYVKVALDVTYVVLGVIFSFLMFGSLKGVGIGTIILAVFAGFIVNFFTKLLTPTFDKFFKDKI